MSNTPSSKTRSRRPFYTMYRKLRFLKYRGTLLHKTPNKTRIKKKRRNWRTIRRLFFLLRIPTLLRWRKLNPRKPWQQPLGNRQFQSLVANSAVFPADQPERVIRQEAVKGKSTGTWRKIRFLLRRKTLFRGEKKAVIPVKKSFSRSRIRRRQLRYLFTTGRLFRIDRKAISKRIKTRYHYLFSHDYLAVIFNSTAMFILAYMLVVVCQDLSSALAAKIYKIGSIIFYWDIDYFIRGDDWSSESVSAVFGAPIIIAFFIIGIALLLYSNMIQERWKIKLLILWVLVHAIVQFFGEIISGAILMQGIGWVMAFMFFTDTDKMVIVMLAMISMVFTGIFITRYLLFSGGIFFTNINTTNRRAFMMSQIFLPFLIGSVIIILVKQPRLTSFEFIVNASMIFIIVPAMLRSRFINDVYFDEEPRKIKFLWLWIIAAIILLTGFRIVLGHGLRI